MFVAAPRPSSHPAFLALGCVGFIASDPAWAANDDAANVDDSGAETIVVTGTRSAKTELESAKAVAPLLDTPRSIVVVDKTVIKETGSATLVDALRTVPGITFGAAEGGNPIGDRPFIRGFDSQGSTYLDGVRDIGSQSREVFAVDQLQVVRGSDSTLGGRGSAGGSLNIISKLPQRRDFVAADVSYGTADYKRVTADANYHLTDSVAVRLAGAWHDQDVAGRDAVFQKRWGVAPSITIGLGTPTRMTLAYYHLDSDELPDSGLPFLYACNTNVCNAPLGSTITTPALGTVTTAGGQTGTVKRSTFYGLKNRDFRDATTDQLTARAEHDFGGITLRNTARFSHTNQAYIFLLPDDSSGNVFGTTVANSGSNLTSGGYVWRRANTRYGYTESLINQTDLYGKFATGGIEHSFAAGIELSWEKARRGAFVTRGFVNSAGNELLSTGSTLSPRCTATTVARYYCTSLFNPNPDDPWVNYANDTSGVQAPISRNLPIAETQNDARTRAIYAFDSMALSDRLILNLGLRYDSFRSTVTPGQPVTATQTFSLTRQDDLVNYQAGLVFKPTPATSFYASYATAATPPNSLLGEGQEFNAFGTTNTQAITDSLQVEKTRSYEIGAKADLFHDRLSLTGALFQTDTRNARVTSDANSIAFIGKRRIRGVELGVNGTLAKGWSIVGGYTYLDAIITDAGFTALTAPAVGAQAAKTVLVTSASNGQPFPQTAKHSFTVWSNYQLTSALTIGGGALYSSRVFGGYADDRAATQTAAGVVTVSPATRILARAVPAYWRFDARLNYAVSDAVGLSVNVQNLTDKAYFNQVYTNHYASIAPGRSAFATLSVKY